MKNQATSELLIWGKHPVESALSSPHCLVRRIYAGDQRFMREKGVADLARSKRVEIRTVGLDALQKKTQTTKHQNIAAEVSLSIWESLKSWMEEHPQASDLLILAMDGVQDPQNIGTMIRSAKFFGADVCVLSKDRSAPITGTVAKASSGAIFGVPLVRTANLARELESLEKTRVWRIGLEAKAEKQLSSVKVGRGSVLLVVGGEGKGLRELTTKRCDELCSLPGSQNWDSLNAAMAASVALYEVVRQRGAKLGKT